MNYICLYHQVGYNIRTKHMRICVELIFPTEKPLLHSEVQKWTKILKIPKGEKKKNKKYSTKHGRHSGAFRFSRMVPARLVEPVVVFLLNDTNII